MRRVIGIGETILDIIFRDGTPTAAAPGGSTFNTMISLGRMGVPATFLTDIGNDRVGQLVRTFMKENGVDDTFVTQWEGIQSPVSLALLNKSGAADYEFFRQPFPEMEESVMPDVTSDDIIIFGSYYALSPASHKRVEALLRQAHEQGAIVVYDVNFRPNHKTELVKLTGTLLDNLEYADIVRGSNEDFAILFGSGDSEVVWKKNTSFYCPRLICTQGAAGGDVRTPKLSKHYPAIDVEVVSTIGAGDSFNAGLIWGLLKHDIRRDDLDAMEESVWDDIIRSAMAFSADTCASNENYVHRGFHL